MFSLLVLSMCLPRERLHYFKVIAIIHNNLLGLVKKRIYLDTQSKRAFAIPTAKVGIA